ncbi:imidazole glycerol phosphate synthase subunit HisH [Jannaschia sp. LMIT008]|uniref:imidazole glycerol phosphate synthase subunit HisH n=1 Tax=Jannaschia maritima TaxID=3032585 RepID=UPI002811F04D|nr:imidazole glycerol phosphate synthase subunit HisH [Jannaschia sp. LMIT008]
MTTVLIDYESGNLHSARKAFERMAREVGAGDVVVTSDPDVVRRADRIVLPGDGAFPACRRGLAAFDGLEQAMVEAVERDAKPFLGICVGMQMLATLGREYEAVPGFDWVPGTVDRIAPSDPALKIPHMGWNDLVVERPHPVLDGVATGDHAYFVHSYAMTVLEPSHRLAHADYGADVTAIVAKDTVVGTQFHPEKSQRTGLRVIANFLRWRP